MYSYDQCTNSVYSDTPLLNVYFGAIETLICYREIEFNGVYVLGFAQIKINDFRNIVLNS